MYHGDFRLGDTLDIKFTTRRFSTGAPYTLAGSPVISAYVGNGTTEITAGITLTVDFDSRTGLNNVRVVATSGNGFATATNVSLVITTGTVDSVSVVGEVVGTFSIENRSALMPTTAARTLDVSAGGEAGVDWANVGSPTTTVGLSGTTVKTATDVETDTQDIQSRIPAALVGGRIDANVGAISSDATAADNAEAFFDGTGYAGTGNVIPTVTTVSGNVNGSVGSVTGAVGSVTAGVTLANGAHGGSAAVITAERIVVASTTAGEPALKLTGNTSGAGLLATGGTSGAGVKAVGGSSSGAGVQVIGTAGNAHAASFTGQGSGDGIYVKGGATGNGVEAEGGASGGDGIITSAVGGNRHGLRVLGAGTGNGIYATGGSSAGSGIMAASSGGGGIGFSAAGDGSSAGIMATGGATGHGVSVVGGGTSGNGINVTTTSGHGINLAPVGTNMHGILSTGGNGGTSDGVSFVAGTGGVGLRAGSLTVTGATTLSGAVSFGSTWGVTGAITFSSTWTGNLAGTVATVTTLTGHTPQTGDSFARIGATGSGLTSLAPSTLLTTALTEGYRADGATGTATQLLYEILQNLTEFGIASTTKTVKKLDGTTTAATYTLDSATTPTSITRAS